MFNSTFNAYGASNSVENFQNRILGPTEIVPYSDIVMQAYPPYAISMEPFVGLKVLVRDTQAHKGTPQARLQFLDQYAPSLLQNQGVIIRETNNKIMMDGYWVITMPVPKTQLRQQLANLGKVLSDLERSFGIVYQDMVDINISGRCPLIDTELSLSQVSIPRIYHQYLVSSDNSPYKLGYIVRINDEYLVLRTRWQLPRNDMFENVSFITTAIQSMFRYK